LLIFQLIFCSDKEFKIFNELTKPFTSVHLKSTIKMPITIKVKKRQFALSAEQK